MKWHSIFNIGWLLFKRDFQYRYRLTYFGYTWAFVRPLLSVVPLILVGKQFNFGANIQGVSYEVFSFVGFILFQVFFDSILMPQWFIRRIRKIVKDIAFPHAAIIWGSCCYILFNLAIYIVELALLFVLFKVPLHPSMVLALLGIPAILISGLSIGIIIAPITFIYLDFRYGLPIVTGLLLWITPILYISPEKGLLHTINKFNPLTYLINVPRAWLIGIASDTQLFILCFSIFAGMFLLGMKFYHRAMSIAIDRIV